MAGNKYIRNNAGQLEELAATQTSAGAGDAGKIVALDAGGHLDSTVMPTGIGADTAIVPASEALAAGDLVNLWTDTGAIKARKADASTSGKEAVGFVLAAVESAANATVYFDGTITGLTGLTPGARYYLSAAAAGGVVTTAPSSAGNIVQEVGYALAAESLSFEPKASVKLA
jgi:hypothetical protein